MSEILFVISSEKSVSIQSPGILTVWTGLAFEKGESLVALLPGSENPHRHENVPEVPKAKRSAKVPLGAQFVGGVKGKGAGYRRGTIEFLEKQEARCGMQRRGRVCRITGVDILSS